MTAGKKMIWILKLLNRFLAAVCDYVAIYSWEPPRHWFVLVSMIFDSLACRLCRFVFFNGYANWLCGIHVDIPLREGDDDACLVEFPVDIPM